MTYDPRIIEIETSDDGERISISRDYDTDPEKQFPVLLYVPNTSKLDHHHLHLTVEGAKALRDWLNDFLVEQG